MSNFTKVSRNKWAQEVKSSGRIDKDELKELLSLGDVVDMDDINDIYTPLVHYLYLFVQNKRMLLKSISHFAGTNNKRPFIIGVSGPVAVGKSTTSRLLKILLERSCPHQKVQLMTTDGFLYPNWKLEKKRLMDSKGFPDSYNMKLLADFLSDVTSGQKEVFYPLYSHELSDIVPGKYGKITNPDILIIEGINTLQIPPNEVVVTSDFFDFSIYIDADENLIRTWFLQRFVHLLAMNKNNPASFYYSWAKRPKAEAVDMAERVWQTVN
ncbi:type I pantothenate kinase, partial [Lactobacillus sp. XV13L]|nr:type I pantothenate kinase [Lactobacillus sp. XV13L]